MGTGGSTLSIRRPFGARVQIIGKTGLLLRMASMAAAGSHSVTRLGTEGAYPPWNFINDNGEVDGFERELGDELCARAELTCEWVTNEWDSIIPNLVSGNYDTIIAGMSITDERDEVIDFTQDYYPPTASRYMAMSDDVDLAGGIIAAQTGDKVDGREAMRIGLVHAAVSAARLDAEVEALAERISTVPINQLMMQKLVINQAVEAMGLHQTQMFATVFDGITRHSPEGMNFKARVEQVGWKEAVQERDEGTFDWTLNKPLE